MPIPESQLETWSHQGAITTSSATYESLKNALGAQASTIRQKGYELYLQGSYKNSTNIRGDSDVDVVVQLNDTFQYDLSSLTQNEKYLFEQAFPGNATYTWDNFRADVLASLRAYYGSAAVTEGHKSLKVAGGNGRLPADVVPALLYRKYQSFLGVQQQYYVEGISFFTQPDRQKIINFPKPHYDNGVTKNGTSRTNGWYKPTVRVVKNARTYMIDHGTLADGLVPSYFLECMIYNVPDAQFGATYQATFCNLVNWLNNAALDTFVCQNGQLPLFGPTQQQWNTAAARTFIQALISLWNSW